MVSSRVVFIALVICCFFLYRNRRRDAKEAKAARDWNDLHTWLTFMFLGNASEGLFLNGSFYYCTITGWCAIIPLVSAFHVHGFLGYWYWVTRVMLCYCPGVLIYVSMSAMFFDALDTWYSDNIWIRFYSGVGCSSHNPVVLTMLNGYLSNILSHFQL